DVPAVPHANRATYPPTSQNPPDRVLTFRAKCTELFARKVSYASWIGGITSSFDMLAEIQHDHPCSTHTTRTIYTQHGTQHPAPTRRAARHPAPSTQHPAPRSG